MLALIPSKVKAFFAAIGFVLVAVFVAFFKGRKSGRETVVAEINKETHKVDQKFQKIDAQPIDFNDAVGKLRKRGEHKP